MTVIVFLNDLSIQKDSATKEDAREGVLSLINVLIALRKICSNSALHSAIPLNMIEVAEGIWLPQLFNDGTDRDIWRFLRSFENKSPFRADLDETLAMEVEYSFEGLPAEGLGLAHFIGTLGVSFGFNPWLKSNIKLQRSYLFDTGDIRQDLVDVRHASKPEHLIGYADWLRRRPLEGISNGDELWDARDIIFPHLQFIPRTEDQIRRFRSGDLRFFSARNALMNLEMAVATWDPASQSVPNFLSKTTPESESRRSKFNFPDLSGTIRCFEMHSRYTPGAGRIHFWLDHANIKAQIGYVGDKVPD